jgi:hypothetical protein
MTEHRQRGGLNFALWIHPAAPFPEAYFLLTKDGLFTESPWQKSADQQSVRLP